MNEKYREYLDRLRETGNINMFLAGGFLQNKFGLDKKQAKKVLLEWMKSKENE